MASRGIGIEFTPSGLRVAALERVGSTAGGGPAVRLVAARDVPVEITDPQAVAHALTQLRQQLRLTEAVVVGLPASVTILSTVRPLIVNPQRAVLGVEFELSQQLPFAVSDAVWHYQWLNGASPKSEQGAVVVALKRSLLDERLAGCQRAGVRLRAVTVNPIAIVNLWALGQRERGAGTLLHIGDQGGTEWIIRTAHLLQVIAVTTPYAPPGEAAWWEELTSSWENVRAQYPEARDRVTVIGPEDLMVSLREPLATRLGVAVDAWSGERVIQMAAGEARQADLATAAVGLGLQALGLAPLHLNLLADSQERAAAVRIQRASLMASTVGMLIIVGLGTQIMWRESTQRGTALRLVEERQELYQSLQQEIRGLLKEEEEIERQSHRLASLAEERTVSLQLLAKLTGVLPDTVWLTKAELDKAGRLDGLLEGRAQSFQDVTRFIDRLKEVPGVRAVRPLATNVAKDPVSGKEEIKFAVQLEIALAETPPPPSPADVAGAAETTPRSATTAPASTPPPSARPSVDDDASTE